MGRSGWHIDGTRLVKPFKIQTMHFWSVSKGGATLFSPLNELVESLPDWQRADWETLYFSGKCWRFGGSVHPLIYPHPITDKSTMVFHCGAIFCEEFLRNFNYKTKEAE